MVGKKKENGVEIVIGTNEGIKVKRYICIIRCGINTAAQEYQINTKIISLPILMLKGKTFC